MTFRSGDFRSYFVGSLGNTTNSFNTYNSYLSRIDRAIGGLDEAIERDGTDKVLNWGRNNSAPPFDNRPSDARSALKRYIQFLIEVSGPPEDASLDAETEAADPTGLAFRLEREMQAAVRKQLSNIEPGLVEADGGTELTTLTGRLDILAKGSKGNLVVVELKAGVCPSGAIEQALGYVQAIQEERGGNVRALLIASEFRDRLRAAAKRIPELQLLKYEFSLKFASVS